MICISVQLVELKGISLETLFPALAGVSFLFENMPLELSSKATSPFSGICSSENTFSNTEICNSVLR